MKLISVLAAAALVTASPFALARTDAEEKRSLLETSTLSLLQAVDIAQAHVSGRAVEANLDTEKGRTVYDIEVLAGDSLYDLDVDAASGEIVKVKEDRD